MNERGKVYNMNEMRWMDKNREISETSLEKCKARTSINAHEICEIF